MKRLNKTRACALFVALAAWALGGPLPAMHPNLPLGFDPDRLYQGGLTQVDQIDLFSGRLSLVLPQGPFAVVYNSNVWRYEIVVEDGEERVRADPDRLATGGLGWHLGLGEVYSPAHWYNSTGSWLYVSEDGNRHVFYQALHNGEDDGDDLVLYSRDGGYLRLVRPPAPDTNYWLDVELPDGTTRRFDSGTGGLGAKYRLIKAWSRFASPEDPDLTVTYNGDDTQRTITDRHGRSHVITLTDEFSPRFERTVTRVDVEAFGGERLIYDFEYQDTWVDVSCKDDAAATPARIRAPHLKRIDNLADGTSYSFSEGGALLYHNVCQGGIEDLPGILKGVNLPTGGKIRWQFQEYEFPPSESNSVFNASAGVASRTLLNADDTPYGGGSATWTYKTTKLSAGQTGGHPEMHTEVVQPTGDCTKHYFDAIYWRSSSTGEGWERGLPFVYTEEVAGRYLSGQVWSSNGGGSCAGSKLRSTYVRYRRDLTPGPSASIEDWANLNRQVSATRVVYHDDGDRYADTELSDFDGIGNSRRVVTTGTFRDDSPNAERRETFTHYNRVDGTYYTSGYEPPAPADPWVLGIFDYVEVTEDDAVGEALARTEYGFESDTGFLFCSRALASGSQRGTGDVLQTFDRDALGQMTDLKVYGGDRQPLATSGADCGSAPAQPAYWLHHEYEYGALKRRQPRRPDGSDGPFPTYDADLDPSTGLAARERDPAGFEVTYDYRPDGRLLSVEPEEGAHTVYTWTAADPAAGTPLTLAATAWDAAGTTVLEEQELAFDDFGVPRLERRKLPEGVWSERQTERNARGWVTAVSQWGDLGQRTERLQFDPFGRAGVIRPPGGAGHDVLLSYQGERRLTREVKMALAAGETYVPRTVELDRYGRRRLVEELAGPGGSPFPTTYAYDVGGRLTETASGTSVVQVRSSTYDGRGFLLAETLPEKGAAGGGTVTYQGHDALGLPDRRLDGPNDLRYEYDFLGRLLRVRDRNQGHRLVTNFGYDSGAGRGLGKLYFATQFNYLDLPWNTQGEERVRVQHVFHYQGVGGRASRKITKLMDWDLGTTTFRQDYAYEELGNVSRITYPRCILAACTGSSAGSGRQVTYGYDQGWLRSVPGWVSEIDYHSSGAWREIHHANGVVDHQQMDPNLTSRPRRLHTTGVQPAAADFDTGIMSYDGAGRLKAMGGDAFAYDSAGRLASASLEGGMLEEQYLHDSFGNQVQRTTFESGSPQTLDLPVDPATNRLTGGATYDAAGNLTSWSAAAGWVFTYDVRNQLTSQAWMRYIYDAFGERVAATPNAGIGQATVHFSLRGLDQQLLSKIVYNNGSWSRDRDYLRAGTRLLARAEEGPFPKDRHLHLDHLGSVRLVTGSDRTVAYEHRYLPFGTEYGFGSSGTDPLRFTGHERDASTGTDYLHARQYASLLSRFLSVDPERGDAARPQSLNRYAYVAGDPLNAVDPTGRWSWFIFHPLTFFDEVVVTAAGASSGPYADRIVPGAFLGWLGTLTQSSRFTPRRGIPRRGLPDRPEQEIEDSDSDADAPEQEVEEEQEPGKLIGFGCNDTFKPVYGGSFSGGIPPFGGSVSLVVQYPNRVTLTVQGPFGGGAGGVGFAGLAFGNGPATGLGVGGTFVGGMPIGVNARASARATSNGATGLVGLGLGASTVVSAGGGFSGTVALYDNCN